MAFKLSHVICQRIDSIYKKMPCILRRGDDEERMRRGVERSGVERSAMEWRE